MATSQVEPGPTRRGKAGFLSGNLIMGVIALVLVGGFLALLVWGMFFKSPGGSGGLAINSKLGEVSIKARPARPFNLNLFDGRTLTLDDLKGKVVMVDFWASWCPPCRQEAPVVSRVYQDYKGRGVEFVGVDVWDKESDARAFLERYRISNPTGVDPKGFLAVDYGVTGIPEKYFIDRDGNLVRKFIGPMDEARLREVLDGLLAGK